MFFCWRIWSPVPFSAPCSVRNLAASTWISMLDFARQSDQFSDHHTNNRATAPYRETAADQAIKSEERLQTASLTGDGRSTHWHYPSFPALRRDNKRAMAHGTGRLMAKLLTFCEEKKMTEITQVKKEDKILPSKGTRRRPNISLSRACGCPSLCLS